jgi:hypothetical protein
VSICLYSNALGIFRMSFGARGVYVLSLLAQGIQKMENPITDCFHLGKPAICSE